MLEHSNYRNHKKDGWKEGIREGHAINDGKGGEGEVVDARG
jgi:hypothetical protein